MILFFITLHYRIYTGRGFYPFLLWTLYYMDEPSFSHFHPNYDVVFFVDFFRRV